MIFYYPNRPTLVPPDPKNPANPSPDYINSLEASGQYVGEKKFNGDNIYIYTNTMEMWTRHKTKHRYIPSPEVQEELEHLPKDGVFNIELMNFRTKTVKNQLVVHCCMVWKGRPLLGKTWGDSRKILEDNVQSGEHVILSQTYTSGFWQLYQDADGAVIEGIILKDPKGKLVFSTTPIDDVGWMKKIRKPCKKYLY